MNFGAIMPILGKAIQGNIGGALHVAMEALGLPISDNEEKNKKVFNDAKERLTPDQILSLKKAEAEYKAKIKQMDLDLEQILSDDRNSARQREMALKDRTPKIIGYLIMGGFFALLIGLMVFDVPEKNSQVLNVMLGALGTMVTAVANYYFGSSSGSKSKDEKIAKMRY